MPASSEALGGELDVAAGNGLGEEPVLSLAVAAATISG